MDYVNINWVEYQSWVERIAEDIKVSGYDYDLIIYFPRGGSPVSCSLAHLLGITETINTKFVIAAQRLSEFGFSEFDISQVLSIDECLIKYFVSNNYSQTLLVDDISDCGDTIKRFIDESGFNSEIACLCYKTGTKVVPDFYAKEFRPDIWVYFPHEIEGSSQEKDH